ncbi:MAG: trypsin-like peptidase domain-containing protein [Oscillospiraceae bacterium]|nr:trypsin-like peptidase domain-containing protein [Oscillospiraceae bacterium]
MSNKFNGLKKSGKVIALAACCSIIGGGLGAGGTFLGMKHFSDSGAAESVSNTAFDSSAVLTNTANVKSDSLMTAAEVYEKNVNSTVGITTSITTNYFGYQTSAAASGSGFIISDDGYILTNHHVIEGADSITVTAYDGTKYKAELVGSYAANDIAVLKIDAKNLVPVSLGSSDNLKVGDNVVAIGNPLGELTFSLTSGVVSALDREITTNNGTMNLIQTDCAINSGNSGGALFNMYGEVIGITNAKYSSSSSGEASIDNIGFAIPVDQIKNMVSSIIEKGYISKPFIGVSVADVSSEMISYGIPEGAVVKEVTDDSPARKAGLEINDIITKADDTEITNSSNLVSYVRGLEKGKTLNLTVYRSGETKEIKLTVEETQISALESEEEDETEPAAQQQYQQNYRNFFGAFPY